MPPAPAGLIWYEYAPGVPVLPAVSSVLGAAYSRYTWIYDSNYATSSFQFSDLDKVRWRAARTDPGEFAAAASTLMSAAARIDVCAVDCRACEVDVMSLRETMSLYSICMMFGCPASGRQQIVACRPACRTSHPRARCWWFT